MEIQGPSFTPSCLPCFSLHCNGADYSLQTVDFLVMKLSSHCAKLQMAITRVQVKMQTTYKQTSEQSYFHCCIMPPIWHCFVEIKPICNGQSLSRLRRDGEQHNWSSLERRWTLLNPLFLICYTLFWRSYEMVWVLCSVMQCYAYLRLSYLASSLTEDSLYDFVDVDSVNKVGILHNLCVSSHYTIFIGCSLSDFPHLFLSLTAISGCSSY